jgi:hypothetical protein
LGGVGAQAEGQRRVLFQQQLGSIFQMPGSASGCT